MGRQTAIPSLLHLDPSIKALPCPRPRAPGGCCERASEPRASEG